MGEERPPESTSQGHWVVVYVAASRERAERVCTGLHAAGLLAQVRGRSPGPIEVMVPRSEASEAQGVLTQVLRP